MRVSEREKRRKWKNENNQVRLHNRWLIEKFLLNSFCSCCTRPSPTLLIHFPLFSQVESLSQLLVEKCNGMLLAPLCPHKTANDNGQQLQKLRTYDSLANMIFTNSIPSKRVISFSISSTWTLLLPNTYSSMFNLQCVGVCCHLSEESFRFNAQVDRITF